MGRELRGIYRHGMVYAIYLFFYSIMMACYAMHFYIYNRDIQQIYHVSSSRYYKIEIYWDIIVSSSDSRTCFIHIAML